MNIIQFPGNTVEREIDKPADIIPFMHGCKNCQHLVDVGDGAYICAERVKQDDAPIVPIIDNEFTSDYGYCGGEFYEREYRKASNGNRR